MYLFWVSCLLLSASLQECDEGAAAKESPRALGYDNLHVAIRGGASFTHEWRNRNFLSLLKDIWFQEHKYSSVTLVWAGNDLTSRWSTPDTSAHAVEEVMAFGQHYGVPIRLVDVVGERYQCCWLSDEPNSIDRWTSKRFIPKVGCDRFLEGDALFRWDVSWYFPHCAWGNAIEFRVVKSRM